MVDFLDYQKREQILSTPLRSRFSLGLIGRRAANASWEYLMARFTKEGIDTTAVYKAAEAFRDRCLLTDGSLLFENAAVWTADNLARFHHKFVEGYDASEGTFKEKLKGQLNDQEQSVKRLAAEMLAVYFLFPINVTARHKRDLVSEVLSWGGDTFPDDHLAWRAFDGGLGGGGRHRRPWSRQPSNS